MRGTVVQRHVQIGDQEQYSEKGATLSSQAGQECDDVEHKSQGRSNKVKSKEESHDDVR